MRIARRTILFGSFFPSLRLQGLELRKKSNYSLRKGQGKKWKKGKVPVFHFTYSSPRRRPCVGWSIIQRMVVVSGKNTWSGTLEPFLSFIFFPGPSEENNCSFFLVLDLEVWAKERKSQRGLFSSQCASFTCMLSLYNGLLGILRGRKTKRRGGTGTPLC